MMSSGLEYLSHQQHLEKQVVIDFKVKVHLSIFRVYTMHKMLIFVTSDSTQFPRTVLTS